MASEYDVKFVVRDHSKPKFNSITHIGGQLGSGDRWEIPITEAIEGIRNGRFAFTVTREVDKPEPLMVLNHPLYGPVLKSNKDGREPVALMSLPEKTGGLF